MDFDFNKFLHIAVWVFAIGSTLIAIAGAVGMWYYYNTLSGSVDLLRMRLKGQVPTYRWKILFLAIFAWIAIFCFS